MRSQSVGADTGPMVPPIRYGFRSFDRQWIIPDKRLINRPGPKLWEAWSDRQIHPTALHDHSPVNGPALSFTELIPDLHHYNNRGGRVFPLWADADATVPNLTPDLLAELATHHGAVDPEDVMAWIAAIAAHPAYTAHFQGDLIRPGLRIPLTTDHKLWTEGVTLGRRVLWLHTYGARCVNPGGGRPAGPPRHPNGPTYAMPVSTNPGRFPETIGYDSAARALSVEGGRWDGVDPAVWAYEVSGKPVLRQWFGYRSADRSRTVIGDRRPPSPLAKMRPDAWPSRYDDDLHELLHVLHGLVALEPAQADLLDRVIQADLIDPEDLPGVAGPSGGGSGDARQGTLL